MWYLPSDPLNGNVGAPSWLTTSGVYAGGIEIGGDEAVVGEHAPTTTSASIATTTPNARLPVIAQG
ncbi:hypothetical protein GOARA_054_00140 [Gordonia araii NBRC 100433]|uniref:Uncharacterized protein n=1 Tax=Gordonia araii NBRC 100433 TaxID=1073574 RepID=G7H313_9ACTN|nr:hypothetical protein GOARA_054_00140 [Gordonia araii NBRC 100433]